MDMSSLPALRKIRAFREGLKRKEIDSEQASIGMWARRFGSLGRGFRIFRSDFVDAAGGFICLTELLTHADAHIEVIALKARFAVLEKFPQKGSVFLTL